jgi:hypothetical protein
MLPFHWLTQTIAFGLGISFSPITIALVALLLLGVSPLRRCTTFLTGWILANGGALGLVVTVGGRLNWAMQLMGKLPELGGLPLLTLGAGCALVSPENLVFFLKEGSMLLTNHTSLRGDLEVGAVFVAITTSLLLLPPLLWVLSGGRLRAPLTALNDWLVRRAEWLVGIFALILGLYLGWQGLEGLRHSVLG